MEIPMAGGAEAPGTPAPLDPALKENLDRLVQEHDLVLFMKGTPQQPQCGFSARAVQALEQLDHPYHAVNVFDQEDPFSYVRALQEWADFPTLPQVWVKGRLIGGSDVALDMVEGGDLAAMLETPATSGQDTAKGPA